MNTGKAYYFFLDYKKTKAAIKAKIHRYNADLLLLWDHNATEFRAKHGLSDTQTYKTLTIKSSEETTMWSILEMFGGYLQTNAICKLAPEEFRINNVALRTKKSDLVNTSTIYRHIRKLLAAGIIKEKIFRGSNTSYELKLNENLIQFRPNTMYNFYLMEVYKTMLGSAEVKDQYLRGISSFSPSLAHFPYGFTLANCNDISTGIILLEHKINIECGIVSIDFLRLNPVSADQSENQTNNEIFDKDKNIDKNFNSNPKSQTSCHKNTNKVPRGGPAASGAAAPENFEEEYSKTMQVGSHISKAEDQRKNKIYPNTEDQKLWKEVLSFYCFAIGILWPDRVITEYEHNKVCQEIYKHFKKAIGNKEVYPAFTLLKGDFLFRILLTKKFLNQNPMWNMEGPISYFSFDAKRGYNGTSGWVERSKKMEENNKLYLDHYKKFIEGWKDYSKNPGMETYRKVSQQLGKMKNECWINYFNKSVANLNNIDTAGTKEIWKNNYQV